MSNVSNRGESVTLPGPTSQALVVTRYELLNLRRSRRFGLVLGVVVATAAVMAGIVGYFRPHSFLSSPLAFYGYWGGYALPLILTFVGVFLGGDSISSEFQNRTGYSMVGNPISRTTIYAGKLLAAFTASMAALLAFLVIEVANGVFYFGSNVPVQFLVSYGLTIIAMLSVLGLAFFLSSLLKNGSLSMLVETVLLLFAFNLMDNVIRRFTGAQPWYVLTYATQVVGSVFSPSWASVTDPTIVEGLVIMTMYLLIGSVVGLVIFQKREFS